MHGGRFLVKRVRIDGVTAFDPCALDAVRSRYVGLELSMDDLRTLASDLERLYRSRGYFLARARVPVQEIVDGEVRVLVVEGRYGRVRVEGNRHYSSCFVREFFAPAREEGIIRDRSLERSMLMLNEFPDLMVRSVLVRGKAPGTTDVILKAEDSWPAHLGIDYNNYGNRMVGRNRVAASLWAANGIMEGDSLFVRGLFPFPSGSDPFVQVDYGAPTNNRGHRVGLRYSGADTRVGRELTVLDIRGEADLYGLAYRLPLERSLCSSSDVVLGLAGKNVKNFIFGSFPFARDEIRALTLAYASSQVDGCTRSVFNTVLTQGLGTALGGSPNGSALSSRVGAGNGFTKLEVDLARIHRLSSKRFLLLRATGQVAGRALTVPEQFSLGGSDSVRGFVQSEYLGDDGYNVSADYRVTLLERKRALVQLAAFADHGGAKLQNAQVGERTSRFLTGAGLGVRASAGSSTAARIDVGLPIGGPNADGERARLYAQVSTRL